MLGRTLGAGRRYPAVEAEEFAMARRILFVQGGGEGAHDKWDNKLVHSLSRHLGTGFEISYPHMPREEDPNYAAWKTAIEKEMARLGEGVIVVGHSIGGMILINALAERPQRSPLAGIFLVSAPYAGEGGWPPEGFEPRKRLGADLPPSVPIYLYHGSADDTAPIAHLDLYAAAIPQAVTRRLEGRDHQLGNDLTEVAHDIRSLDAR
jgi:predicted alpha/beta hydrolase family esterase